VGFTPEAQKKAQDARRLKPRSSRKEKMTSHGKTFARMRRLFPKMALPLIAQAEKGSTAAMVKLKCLDCVCWVKAEVRDCTVVACPLYPVRPYQKLRGGNPNDSERGYPWPEGSQTLAGPYLEDDPAPEA
jgi:hypothetical protein